MKWVCYGLNVTGRVRLLELVWTLNPSPEFKLSPEIDSAFLPRHGSSEEFSNSLFWLRNLSQLLLVEVTLIIQLH